MSVVHEGAIPARGEHAALAPTLKTTPCARGARRALHLACLVLGLVPLACSTAPPPAAALPSFAPQGPEALLAGRVVAVAYSPYRAGQHPDQGAGAVEPADDEILEDLLLLARDEHFTLLRLYSASSLSARILDLIARHDLPMRVMLGAWLDAELSTHETCAWVKEPVPEATLRAHAEENARELERAIALAKQFEDIVVAVNVGNEVLVDWNDHRVDVDVLIGYVRHVKAAIAQPVTVADNYVPWTTYPAIGAVVDFATVHTYPVWEGRGIDDGLAYTVENLRAVQAANPGLPIVIGEAGWATVATEFGARASEAHQARYYRELFGWAREHRVTTFFFEAFDERWKGSSADPLGAEKHWGLFDEARRPKAAIRALYKELPPATP